MNVKVKKGVFIHEGVAYHVGDKLDVTEAIYNNNVDYLQTENEIKVENNEIDLEELKVAELKAMAEQKGLDVVGTGNNGSVTKADYIKALS